MLFVSVDGKIVDFEQISSSFNSNKSFPLKLKHSTFPLMKFLLLNNQIISQSHLNLFPYKAISLLLLNSKNWPKICSGNDVKELLDKISLKEIFLWLNTKVSFEKLFSDNLFPLNQRSLSSNDKRVQLPNDSILLRLRLIKLTFLK